jgi:5-methylcytosine-specific restriction endonuclease McrA
MKECTKCHRLLPLSEFYKDNRNKDNCRERCKECYSERAEEYYKKNKKKILDHCNEYREQNKEKEKRRHQIYYNENREQILERAREYRNNNPDKERKRHKRWRKQNPEKTRASWHRYKAKKLKAKGTHTHIERDLITRLQKGKCLSCGEKSSLTIDHIIPLSRGGRNDLTNLQGLCKVCNSKKHTQSIDYRSKALKQRIFKQFELFEF